MDTSKYSGEAKHCCLMMDLALGEGYLFPTIAINFDPAKLKTYPPHVAGPSEKPGSRKHKPDILVNFCPWCGKDLRDEERDGKDPEGG